jgi:hypothetical protein
MSNAIDINTSSPNITSCTLKCDLTFDYRDISDLTITNMGAYLSLKSNSENTPITYNLTTYNVKEIRLYSQTINKFNGQTSDGELIIIHTSDQGKNPVHICVPIKKGNSSAIETSVLSSVLSQAKRGAHSTAPNSNQVVMQEEDFVYNLNDFVPRKPFYMAVVNSVNYIIFPPSSDTYVYINTSDFDSLTTITTQTTYTPVNPQISYNAKGPTVSTSDEIYIDCQPVGESNDLTTVVNDNGKPALSSEFNLKNFFSNMFIQLILGSLVFVIFIVIVNKFLDAMSSKNTTTVLKTAAKNVFKG